MEVEFSAVIPVYNREITISRAIRSALDQSFPAKRIIVVDDGSTDGTSDCVRSFGHHVTYLRQENAGVSSARNSGIATCKTEWIAFLDSDDYWRPDHLATLARAIEATGGGAACYFSDAELSGSSESPSWWTKVRFTLGHRYELCDDARAWGILRSGQPVLIQASAFRRSALIDVGAFDVTMQTREDTLLIAKLSLNYSFCAVNGCEVVITDDAAQRLTKQFPRRHSEWCDATIKMYLSLLNSETGLKPGERQVLESRLFRASLDCGRGHLEQWELFRTAIYLGRALSASPKYFFRWLGPKMRSKRTGLSGNR